MIDIENELFTALADILRNKYGSDFTVYGETVLAPSVFPCACIEESDNFTYTKTQDSTNSENHAELVYDVNIYSDKRSGKKTQCKEILAVIDNYFINIGFTRTTKKPISLDDPTKYRLFARYSAVVSKNSKIYRR
ncbi:MAG: hypothetical protein ACI4IS_02870 [Acutalibacteraceae bacterium]